MSRKDLETVEPWRSALREGDPALGAPDLDRQEIAKMRRAVLTAAGGQPEKTRLLPRFSAAWGGALVMAAALLLALGLWWLPNREEPALEPQRVSEKVQGGGSSPLGGGGLEQGGGTKGDETGGGLLEGNGRPASLTTGPAPLLTSPLSQPPPAQGGGTHPIPAVVPEAETALAEATLAETAELDWSEVPVQPAIAEDEALPRQVQLTTPGGTRVIWVLEPQDDATQEALSAGPEEKTE